jgi:alpha-tubulin suppressor-like RCC1 family protein
MRRLVLFRENLAGTAAVAAVLALLAFPGAAQALPVSLSSVACPSASQCTGVGEGQEGTFEPVSPVSPTTIPAAIDSGGSLVSVACPSASKYCTAIAGGGQEVTFEPGPGTLKGSSPVTIDSNGDLTSVACPTEEQCTAVDRYGYEVTFDPTTGKTVSGSFERIDASGGIQSVACPTQTQCTVVDFNGQEVTFEPGSNHQISLERLEVGELSSVACPSSTQCTAVDAEGHEVTFEPGSPGLPPSPLPTIDGTNGLTGVACPTEKQCTAVDSSGQAVTFEPKLGTTISSPTTIDSGNGLTGVACPTEKQCTAVDPHGHEVTFEPKSGKTNPSTTTIGSGGAPSSSESTISVKPNPTLVFEPGGKVEFEVVVTVKDEKGDLLQGDSVSLEVNRFEGSTPVNPEITNSNGEATFDKVTCFAPYCEAGHGVSVTATDPSGLKLEATESVSGIFFVGPSYEGQTDTLEILGLPTADDKKLVELSLEGSPVRLGSCNTNSTGSLPLAGEQGACTFTVPSFPGKTPPASIPAVVTVDTQTFDVTFALQPVSSLIKQTINITSMAPMKPTVGESYTPVATGGGSKNPVVFTISLSSTPGACSILTLTAIVTFEGAGECVIDANQSGNATYQGAEQVQQKIEVVKRPYSPVVAWGEGSDVPVPVSLGPSSSGDKVTAVSAGGSHNLALLENEMTRAKTVIAWGDNLYGQLGNGTQTNSTEPVPVCAVGTTTPCSTDTDVLEEVVAVSASPNYSLALLKDGKVVAWGGNGEGQLGDGKTNTTQPFSDVPVEVELPSKVEATAVSAGGDHSLALLKDGKVVAWGGNPFGELGDGKTTSSDEPVAVCAAGETSCTLATGELTEVTSVAASEFGGESDYSLAVSNGTVMAWGQGALGNDKTGDSDVPVAACEVGTQPPCTAAKGNLLDGAAAVSAGSADGLALLGGEVAAWGDGDFGALGNDSALSTEVPMAVCEVEATKPCSAGANSLEHVTAVSAGYDQSLALLNGGTVTAWGYNAEGQLGNGTKTDSKVPVAVCEVEAKPEAGEICSASNSKNGLLEKVVAVSASEGENLALLAPAPAKPVVTSIIPASGPTAGGTSVTIEGTGFGATTATNTVTIGGAAASVTAASATSLTVTTPVGSAGAASVVVANTSDGLSVTDAGAYTFLPSPPTVTSITPSSGPDTGNQTVTIKGTGFVAGAEVLFEEGGQTNVYASDVHVVSDEELTALTPANSPEEENVVVRDANGSSPVSNLILYTFLPSPPLTNTASGTSTNSSTPAEATDGPVTATASGGIGTVTVGQYGSDPVGAPAFESSNEYIDVFLAPGSTFTSLTFTDCELNGGEHLYWYENGKWEKLSEPSPAVYEQKASPQPCITVTLNKNTSPKLEQLTGTVFGVALPPASTSGSSTPASALSTSLSPLLTTPLATTAAIGSVSLDGSTIPVKGGGAAAVKLTCTGTATCGGKLTLTAETKGKTTTKGKGKGKKQAKTEAIGTAGFSIPAGKTATVKLTLNAAGKALLQAAHGKLSATLTILKSSPSPSSTQSVSVHLSQQKATKAKQGKKK